MSVFFIFVCLTDENLPVRPIASQFGNEPQSGDARRVRKSLSFFLINPAGRAKINKPTFMSVFFIFVCLTDENLPVRPIASQLATSRKAAKPA
jgi:hypothetical protein